MNENLTEVVCILDRSGSMSHLTNDTIGGFNSFIATQKEQEGEAILTTVLFDNHYEVLHDCVNVKDVSPLTNTQYYARGTTALLDAIGKTINTVSNKLNQMQKAYRPSKVIVVITTDGYENASVEFSQEQVKKLIESHTENGWQFLFLGANMDAITTAKDFGINGEFASTYSATSAGTTALYSTVSKTVSNYRSRGIVDVNWKEDIK